MQGRHFEKDIKVIGKWRASRSFAHFAENNERGTFRQNKLGKHLRGEERES